MFDKLEDILVRLEEILNELNEPTVANDTTRFQKLMKEQSELQDVYKRQIVTNGFHIYRSSKIAQKKMQCKVYGIGAKNSRFLQMNYLLREFFGVVKDRLVGNL